jgi:hypothetical protein
MLLDENIVGLQGDRVIAGSYTRRKACIRADATAGARESRDTWRDHAGPFGIECGAAFGTIRP